MQIKIDDIASEARALHLPSGDAEITIICIKKKTKNKQTKK